MHYLAQEVDIFNLEKKMDLRDVFSFISFLLLMCLHFKQPSDFFLLKSSLQFSLDGSYHNDTVYVQAK